MIYEPIDVDRFENTTSEPAYLEKIIKLNPGARIIKSRLLGPTYLNRNTQVGPDAVVGRYFGMNESCYVARATIGHFCSIGARTAINPFNHPIDWLSIHEFQYHPNSFDWVDEYNAITRLARTVNLSNGPATVCSFRVSAAAGNLLSVVFDLHVSDLHHIRAVVKAQ